MTPHLLMPWRRPASASIPPLPAKPVGGWGSRDRLTKTGAEQTAREIINVWAKRGHYNVRAWTEPIEGRGDKGPTLHAVRTNLVGGLPPR